MAVRPRRRRLIIFVKLLMRLRRSVVTVVVVVVWCCAAAGGAINVLRSPPFICGDSPYSLSSAGALVPQPFCLLLCETPLKRGLALDH